MGHVRRERGAGYSTLPMPQSGHHTLPHSTSSGGSPQIGMVHPIPQQSTPPMSAVSSMVTSMANMNDMNMPRK